MEISQLISDIALYLELYAIQERKTDFNMMNNTQGNLMKQQICVYVSERSNNDPQAQLALIKNLIDHCSEEALDELLNEYGEESEIGQIIRMKRIEKYQRTLAAGIENIQEDIEMVIGSSKHINNPFYEKVCEYIDKKGYSSDSDFYNSIGMPRQLFARLRDSKASLSKKTVLWIIIGLELNYVDARELLLLAGYSFKKNDKKDVIISYILRNANYDLYSVNEILHHFELDPFC